MAYEIPATGDPLGPKTEWPVPIQLRVSLAFPGRPASLPGPQHRPAFGPILPDAGVYASAAVYAADPTRCARHGLLFTSVGNKKVLHSSSKHDFTPIDKNCLCLVCRNYTLAYLHHLFKAKEMTTTL